MGSVAPCRQDLQAKALRAPSPDRSGWSPQAANLDESDYVGIYRDIEGLCRDYIGTMEKNVETTILQLT